MWIGLLRLPNPLPFSVVNALSIPLSFSAKRQRAPFDAFVVTVVTAYSFKRLVEPWEYSKLLLVGCRFLQYWECILLLRHHTVVWTADADGWTGTEYFIEDNYKRHCHFTYVPCRRSLQSSPLSSWIFTEILGYSQSIWTQVVGSFLQRKYALRSGEQAIIRDQPKINKPYDKTQHCMYEI